MRIKDLIFEVTSADVTVGRTANGGLLLNILVGGKDQKVDETIWSPCASLEDVGIQRSSMDEVFGRKLHLLPGTVDDQYPQLLLVFTHEAITNSVILINKVAADTVDLKWNATCAVNFNDAYHDGLEFSIETRASLKYSEGGFDSGVKLEVLD